MSAAAVLDPPADVLPDPASQRRHAQVFSGALLGLPVTVQADRSLPVVALDYLLTQMDEQWDLRRRRSDLARVTNHPNLMVAVSPLTLLLVRDVLTAVHLADRADVASGACRGMIDARHSRVGLDPTVAAISARLAPAAAADLLAQFCLGHGARTGQVRVGAAVRRLEDPVPAWLQHVAADLAQVVEPARLPRRVRRSAPRRCLPA